MYSSKIRSLKRLFAALRACLEYPQMNRPQIPNARPYAAEGLLMFMAAYKEPKDMRQVSNRYIVAFILKFTYFNHHNKAETGLFVNSIIYFMNVMPEQDLLC